MIVKPIRVKRGITAFGTGLILLWLLLVCTVSAAEVVDRIAAVVNDDIILLSELDTSFAPYLEKIKAYGYAPEKEREMLFKARETILNQMIDQKLTDQEVEKMKITVSQKEIDNSIERIKEANFYTDEDLRKALARDGKTLEQFRKSLREQILRKKLINFEIKSKIVVTSEDVKAYYDRNLEKFRGETKIRLKNILQRVPAPAAEAQKSETLAQMVSLHERIESGESFEALARIYSQSPLAAEGGDLGFFKLADLAPWLQAAIRDLKQGEMTAVLDTDQGYQIFLVKEIVQQGETSLAAATPKIEQQLFAEIVDQKFQAWLKNLRSHSHIKIVR